MESSTIRRAETGDLHVLCTFDHIARTDPRRREFIEHAVLEERAWVIQVSETIAGYAVERHDFFGYSFLDMVYIENGCRGRGLGPELIRFMEGRSRTASFFTSTNRSNRHMRHVLEKLGYRRSGIIRNLDPGDPELIFHRRVETN